MTFVSLFAYNLIGNGNDHTDTTGVKDRVSGHLSFVTVPGSWRVAQKLGQNVPK
jgi:hypothetical protein